MKLISLNAWGGQVPEIMGFFAKYKDVDVFLLQEVFDNGTEKTVFHENEKIELFREICEALPGHQGYFAPSVFLEWGLAIFIKKSIPLLETGDYFVYLHRDSLRGQEFKTVGRNLQFIKINHQGKTLNIINFHGLHTGEGKEDCLERIEQSKKLIDFTKGLEGEIILAGDFNLKPETESLIMLERELNLKNLIKDYKIDSTRTSYYNKSEKFADYALCSEGIKVKEFATLPEEVSDHKALFLEFK